MKFILYIFFLCYSYCSSAQNGVNLEDTIHWKANHKLKWEDFQGVPDSNSIGGAGTSSGFFYHSYYDNDTTLVFVVECIFFKKNSWVKGPWRTSYSLNHEQGHFNITEVYARKLRLEFRRYRLNKNTVLEDTKNISDLIHKEEDSIQALYDKETTYPVNKIKQKEWDKKIRNLLKKYLQY